MLYDTSKTGLYDTSKVGLARSFRLQSNQEKLVEMHNEHASRRKENLAQRRVDRGVNGFGKSSEFGFKKGFGFKSGFGFQHS